jgi:hypothetical protein
MPGVGLRAELDSVLVYRRGGFFWPHRASTKGPQHVGTLEVLLGPVTGYEGGDLVLYSRGPGIASWRPTAAGDWAMWFKTERHEVLPVTAGTRMVACYNIFVDADAVGFSAVVPPLFARRIRRRRRGVTRYPPRCTLSGVPVEVLQRIAQFLGAGSVKKLSVSCRRLHMAVGDPVTLLTAYFQERRAKIIGCCRAAGMTHVLLPLFHDYPLDGGEETLLCLRGRDRVMYAAAQAVFGEGVTMEPCEYIGTVARVQYEVRHDSVEDPEVAEEFVGGYPQRARVQWERHRTLESTCANSMNSLWTSTNLSARCPCLPRARTCFGTARTPQGLRLGALTQLTTRQGPLRGCLHVPLVPPGGASITSQQTNSLGAHRCYSHALIPSAAAVVDVL